MTAPVVHPLRSYIILSTPRSGSNWLCELLSAVGTLGHPQEYFWPGWRTRWGELDFPHMWERVLLDGTTPNHVFGVKLMWYQIEALCPDLRLVLGRPGASASELLAQAFSNPLYVLLTRRDRVRQAVSLERANQSDQWRSVDLPATDAPPQYDRARIDHHLAFLAAEEARFRDFCATQNVDLTELVYEDVVAAPEDAVKVVAELLQVPLPSNFSPGRTEHQRQADSISAEWVRRYEAGD